MGDGAAFDAQWLEWIGADPATGRSEIALVRNLHLEFKSS
jgi:hypothetical protein